MNSSAVKEATAAGQTIWEYDSKKASLNRVRFAYEKLAQWITETPEQTLFGE
jgi:cellulose biosynthesis protein BcsQ